MFYIRYVIALLATLIVATGCSVDGGSSSSSSSLVSFQLPGALGNGSLSGTTCYAVSITGEGMGSTAASQCDASYGTEKSFVGLVPPNSTVELEATQGNARQIDLYLVMLETGSCDAFAPENGLGQTFGSNNIYRVGSATKDFNGPEVTVEIQLAFPSNTNRLSQIISAPASCTQGDTTMPIAKLPARPVLGAVLTSTSDGSTMRVRVVDQQIELDHSINSIKIQPARLGEDQ